MNHTPGPWDQSKIGYVYKNGVLMPPAPDETRAPGESWLDMRKRIAPEIAAREKECAANAKLTAAAPELLEALQMVASKIKPGDDRPGDTFADFDDEETEQIFVALAKAT